MLNRHFLVVFAAAMPMLAASAALARPPICAERHAYVEYLKVTLNETQEEIRLVSERNLAELFVSPIGTWTLLATSPKGISCLAASGDGLAKRASL
jgi:hypothetical protein